MTPITGRLFALFGGSFGQRARDRRSSRSSSSASKPELLLGGVTKLLGAADLQLGMVSRGRLLHDVLVRLVCR